MRSEGCPSDLELERVLRGEAVAAAEHAKGCEKCAPRLAEMRELGQRFAVSVFPKLRDRVGDEASRRRFTWLWPVLVPVAVALVAFVLWPKGPAPDYIGMKGGGGGSLEVYLGEGNQGRLLGNAALVHPGDGLRFFVVSPSNTAFVFTVDATGKISRLYPTGGEAPAPVSGLLPGGAILDDVTGPERVFAVYPARPMTFGEVEAAVNATFKSTGDLRLIDRLPLEAAQSSVLLEKVAR